MAKPELTRRRGTMPRALAALALPAAVALLAACATSAQPRGPTGVLPARASYLAYAGPPVDHFTWLGRYMGWEALSDNELVLFLSPTKAYYIKVWSPCGDRGGLRWVYNVQVPKTGGAVYARFDTVLADHWRCPISELRPVDWGRMKVDALAAHRALPAGVAPSPGGSPQPGGGPPPDATSAAPEPK
jgi:Family of unknown function (DUF6491)